MGRIRRNNSCSHSSSDYDHTHKKRYDNYRRRKHHGDDWCRLNCDTKVDVDVEAKPRIKCKEYCQRNACFDVALDIETKPKCYISHKKSKKISDCKERCIFTVNLDCDYKCKPKILNDCRFPSARFDLEVDTITKQICKAKKDYDRSHY